jgi:ribosomal protein L37E
VPATLHVQEPTPFRHSEVTAPNWKLVPFEVGCARCGHDLRGLTEPKCPSCGLEFEWLRAVPIEQLVCRKCGYHLYGLTETRCPECGEPFTWAEVLDDYHRKRKPLFEYRWHDRPFRSLVYTWWLALRPWKLWRTVDLYDPPNVGGLCCVLLMGLAPGIVLGTFGFSTLSTILLRYGGSPWSVLPLFFAQSAWAIIKSVRPLAVAALASLAWWAATFGALMLLVQSMRRCNVRAAQVLRVCTYALVPLLPATVTGAVAIVWFHSFWLLSWAEPAPLLWCVALMFHVVWSIRCGYRVYLRIPHSLGVAVASQTIALLVTLNAYLLFASFVF